MKLKVVQTLYFALLPLLLIVASSSYASLVGKKHPFFQLVRLTLLSVFSHPKNLELREAAACVPDHYQVKVAVQ